MRFGRSMGNLGGSYGVVFGGSLTQSALILLFPKFYRRVAKFIISLYEVYKRQYFTYMEINPLVITDTSIYMLDFAAKVE